MRRTVSNILVNLGTIVGEIVNSGK
jgi:hypothetical protein